MFAVIAPISAAAEKRRRDSVQFFWEYAKDWFEKDLETHPTNNRIYVATVKKEGSFLKIAHEGNRPDRLHEIVRENPGKFWDDDHNIFPGEKLNIMKSWLGH